MGTVFIWPKNNVYAANCTGTQSVGYQLNNNWYTGNVIDGTFHTQAIPQQIYVRTNDTNIKNSLITYQTSFILRLYGVTKEVVNPSINIQYGTTSSYTNVNQYCTRNINKYYHEGEFPNNYVELGIAVNCSFKGDNSSANMIQTRIFNITEMQSNTPMYYDEGIICTKISPTDTEQLILNQNQNTGKIINSLEEVANNIINSGTTPAGSTTNVDSTQYNNTHGKEMGLLNGNQFNPNTINITKDDNTINWILNYIYTLYHTNYIVGGLMITLLSIGLIKLALNR